MDAVVANVLPGLRWPAYEAMDRRLHQPPFGRPEARIPAPPPCWVAGDDDERQYELGKSFF